MVPYHLVVPHLHPTDYHSLVYCLLADEKRLQTKHLRHMKAQEAEHLRRMNEELQNEIEEKNAELFTQTSFIIRKMN